VSSWPIAGTERALMAIPSPSAIRACLVNIVDVLFSFFGGRQNDTKCKGPDADCKPASGMFLGELARPKSLKIYSGQALPPVKSED
jgi:hypothetical protein